MLPGGHRLEAGHDGAPDVGAGQQRVKQDALDGAGQFLHLGQRFLAALGGGLAETLEHQAALDVQIVGQLLGDGGALELVGDALDGGQQELQARDAAIGGAHVELGAGAVGEP